MNTSPEDNKDTNDYIAEVMTDTQGHPVSHDENYNENPNQNIHIDTNDNPTTIKEELKSPARKKLDSMMLGDGSFETLMKQRSQLRKHKEEQSLAQLRIQLTSSERALTAETQRRVESIHAIKMTCTERIQEMEANFQRILSERSARMEDILTSVQQKIEELTDKFEEEKDRIPKEMERRGAELMEMVNKFQKELSEERNDRLSREGRILKQMDDHSTEILFAIEKESHERETIANELQKQYVRMKAGGHRARKNYKV